MNQVSRSRTARGDEPDQLCVEEAISLLVIDDVCVSRETLANLLRGRPWAGEVRTAADAEAATLILRSFRPALVLLSMASPQGLATLAVVHGAAPATRVIAVAVTDSEEQIIGCAEQGVVGFLSRHATFDELERTVVAVARGEAVCSQWVAGALLRRVTTLATQRNVATETARLTPREREVLLLIEQAMTNKQIALRLGIEVRTVKNHVHNLLEKLRVHRRGDAAAQLRSARVPAVSPHPGVPTASRNGATGRQTPPTPRPSRD